MARLLVSEKNFPRRPCSLVGCRAVALIYKNNYEFGKKMRDIYKNFEYSRDFRNFRKFFLINGENLYGVPKFLIFPEKNFEPLKWYTDRKFFGAGGRSPKIICSKKIFSGTGWLK
jgi:hypothetical protein